MEFDDELEDEGPSAPLLPAPDRLWRHPSEVGFGHRTRRGSHHDREPKTLTVAFVAAVLGALVAAGGTMAAGGLRTRVRTVAVPALERHVEPVAVTIAMKGKMGPGQSASTGPAATGAGSPVDVVAITQRMRPAIVGLQVQRAKQGGVVAGSGVMFRSDGYLLTDARLVAGAAAIVAVLDDTRRFTARVLGTDPESGIALMKIAGSGYEVAALGSTDDVQAGQPAIAIGATMTSNKVPEIALGKVRAVARSMDDGVGDRLVGMIQTDTPPAPGSVGGALVDVNGVVIGITEESWSTTGSGAALAGTAAPIDLAYAVATQLMVSGHVTHAWLGIDGQDLDTTTATAIGVGGGALVDQVQEASPASASGLDVGDVITAVNNRLVTSMASLTVAIRTYSPGDQVFLHLHRDGNAHTIRVVLGDRPPSGT